MPVRSHQSPDIHGLAHPDLALEDLFCALHNAFDLGRATGQDHTGGQLMLDPCAFNSLCTRTSSSFTMESNSV